LPAFRLLTFLYTKPVLSSLNKVYISNSDVIRWYFGQPPF